MKLTKSFIGAALFCCAVMTGCSENKLTLSGLDSKAFESNVDGKETGLYVLKNANGVEVCVTNFGGRIVSLMVPDKNGEMRDVVLGFDSISTYRNVPSDFGASVGRYANRINKGKIVVDGDTIQLPTNNFGHCLHGGPQGWQYQIYKAEQKSDSVVVLTMDSPDGDANFPGHVVATVTYTLTYDNCVDIKYEATTDKKTVINMTNHSYFNLSGDPTKPITDHLLTVNADNFTPVDSTYMTTGEIIPVAETPMDFTKPKAVGQDIDKFDYVQVKNGNGYDHNWVLNTKGDFSQIAATLYCPSTGINVDCYTDEPGIQVYSGNFLDGTVTGKKGIVYKQRTGICLETQKYPDAPNKPEWPSAWLEPGQKYTSHTMYKFSVK